LWEQTPKISSKPISRARHQQAPGGENYETPELVMQGYEWETLDLLAEIHKEFNEYFITYCEFSLRQDDKQSE